MLLSYSGPLSRAAATYSAVPGLMEKQELESQFRNIQRAYRHEGHLCANIDPLGLAEHDPNRVPFRLVDREDLLPKTYGFGARELNRDAPVNSANARSARTLREALEQLHTLYCGSVGTEYVHIVNREERTWIEHRIETTHAREMHLFPEKPETHKQATQGQGRGTENTSYDTKSSLDEALRYLKLLTRAELFEQFLGRRYSGAKRFVSL